MIDAKEWLSSPREERQAHLNLDASCLERGGNSTNHRGVLAQYLDTSIPAGRVILAHACGNRDCSNPLHLYWATDKENIVEDGKKFGTWKHPFQRRVEKLGYTEACKQQANPSKNAGRKKGSKLTEEHKENIRQAIIKKYSEKK